MEKLNFTRQEILNDNVIKTKIAKEKEKTNESINIDLGVIDIGNVNGQQSNQEHLDIVEFGETIFDITTEIKDVDPQVVRPDEPQNVVISPQPIVLSGTISELFDKLKTFVNAITTKQYDKLPNIQVSNQSEYKTADIAQVDNATVNIVKTFEPEIDKTVVKPQVKSTVSEQDVGKTPETVLSKFTGMVTYQHPNRAKSGIESLLGEMVQALTDAGLDSDIISAVKDKASEHYKELFTNSALIWEADGVHYKETVSNNSNKNYTSVSHTYLIWFSKAGIAEYIKNLYNSLL